MLVAHDVNPILPYLDCVGYIAAGSAVCGPPESVITSQTLTALYRTPIEVLHASDGRLVVVGEPEPPARHADRHADAAAPVMTGASRGQSAPGLEHRHRRAAVARVRLHGQRLPGGHDRRGRRRSARLVHGAAPPVLRRAHARDRVVSWRCGGDPGSGSAPIAGYFAAAIGAALVIAAVPRSIGGQPRSSESAIIGTVQAFALACGALFVSLYGGFLNGLTGLLFGSFLGISAGQVLVLLVVAAAALAVLALIARPCSSRPSTLMWPRRVASRSGCSARVFLVLLGCAAAEVSQITGALLVFALLVMPAGDGAAAHGEADGELLAHDPDRPADRVARPGRRLLLGLSGRVLHHDLRLRWLRPRRRRAPWVCACARRRSVAVVHA